MRTWMYSNFFPLIFKQFLWDPTFFKDKSLHREVWEDLWLNLYTQWNDKSIIQNFFISNVKNVTFYITYFFNSFFCFWKIDKKVFYSIVYLINLIKAELPFYKKNIVLPFVCSLGAAIFLQINIIIISFLWYIQISGRIALTIYH